MKLKCPFRQTDMHDIRKTFFYGVYVLTSPKDIAKQNYTAGVKEKTSQGYETVREEVDYRDAVPSIN